MKMTKSCHHFYNCDCRIINELLTVPLGYGASDPSGTAHRTPRVRQGVPEGSDFIERHILSFFNTVPKVISNLR